jgi:hypothetical protein
LRLIVYNCESSKSVVAAGEKFSDESLFEPLFFDSEEFQHYHERFAESVFHTYFEGLSGILGYCFIGKNGKTAELPYSSPFSLIYPRRNWRIEDIFRILQGLIDFCSSIACERIVFTLPPEIYNPSLVYSLQSCLFSTGFKVLSVDIDQYFDLSTYESKEQYLSSLMRMTRRNYNAAIKSGLEFNKLEDKDFEEAYEVIEQNRKEMGYPLKIPKTQMRDIINFSCSSSSCFLVKRNNEAIASAIVFDVTDEISQVIYWGDKPEYRRLKPMALLSTGIFDYYKRYGKKYIDIGPSSDKGIVNPGLFEFKRSLGCRHTVKLSFEYRL